MCSGYITFFCMNKRNGKLSLCACRDYQQSFHVHVGIVWITDRFSWASFLLQVTGHFSSLVHHLKLVLDGQTKEKSGVSKNDSSFLKAATTTLLHNQRIREKCSSYK